MTEYIERKALVHHLENCIDEVNNTNGYTEDFKTCLRLVKNLPAADVEEVKHGKWIQEQIKIENMSIVRYRNTCSECGGKADFLLRELHYSYCPHCGAKMDLED